MIKLPKRLETIANIVPLNSNIIDIGCDHGLLDIYLCQKGICKKIIASDINKSALSNAIANIKKEKFYYQIFYRARNYENQRMNGMQNNKSQYPQRHNTCN